MAIDSVRLRPGVYFMKNTNNSNSYEYEIDNSQFTLLRGTALIVNVKDYMRYQVTAELEIKRVGDYKDQIIGGGIVDVN